MTVRRARSGALRTVHFRATCVAAPVPPAPPLSPPALPPTVAPTSSPTEIPPFPTHLLDPGAARASSAATAAAYGTCYPGSWWPSYAEYPARWYIAPEGYAWVAYSWACLDDNVSFFLYYYYNGGADANLLSSWTPWTYAIKNLYAGPVG